MSNKIYRVGDKVLVDELYGTGSTVVTIDRVFFYGDQETVRTYSAGKRQFIPSEIHGPADDVTSESQDDEIQGNLLGEQIDTECIRNLGNLMRKIGEPRDENQEVLGTNERALVLEEAERLINGQRANDYGSPQTNFGRIAKLWEPILGVQIKPTDVALMLTQLKIARLINSPAHRDSWIDAAGYVGLGAELAKDQS